MKVWTQGPSFRASSGTPRCLPGTEERFAGYAVIWSPLPLRACTFAEAIPGILRGAGILLGVVVFGDVISVSPGMLALQAAGIVTLVTGVIMVARAPCLSSLRHVPALPVPLPQHRSDEAATRRSETSPV